ncbi:MAG TPA: hypothetical protein VIF62_22665 [Labilithrix sp.]|jgi:hypothetical protein
MRISPVALVVALCASCAIEGAGFCQDDARERAVDNLHCLSADIHVYLVGSKNGEHYCAKGCGGERGYVCGLGGCMDDPLACALL